MTRKSGTDRGLNASQQPRQGRLRETPLPITVEDILHQGEQVARLLNDEIFNLAYRSSILEIQDEILQSNPEEKNKREGLYLEARSLNRVANRLIAMLNAAQHENEKLRATEHQAQAANRAHEVGIG